MGKQEGRGSNAPAGGQSLDRNVASLTGEKTEDAGVDNGRWGAMMANACVEVLF